MAKNLTGLQNCNPVFTSNDTSFSQQLEQSIHCVVVKIAISLT